MFTEILSRKFAQAIPYKLIKSRNTTAIVSYSFDDFPKSAASNAAKILGKRGFLGTFYTCGKFLGGQLVPGLPLADEDDVIRLKNEGHEIGCHTFSHLDCQRSSKADLATDLAKNSALLKSMLGQEASSFAYPSGKMDRSSQKTVIQHYSTARSVVPGLNYEYIDLSALKAYCLYSESFDLVRLKKVVLNALKHNAWLIFYTHDVASDPSPWGCRPDEFGALVEMTHKMGMTVLPVKQALQLVS